VFALAIAWALSPLFSSMAWALPPVVGAVPELIDEEGIRLSLRAIAESWEEPQIQLRFGTSRGILVGLSLGVPLHEYLFVDFEMGFKRLIENVDDEGHASGDVIDLMPMSLQLQGRLALGQKGEIFLGLGPTLTPFRHLHPDTLNAENGEYSTNGAKLAGELRAGFRIDTGLIQPARAPGIGREFKAVDFEGYVGRRFQVQPEGIGYDLAAFRLGVGLSFRF
jgi:hypothetical protein